MIVPVLEWPLVLAGCMLLTYVPHLLLRVPAVHAKLAAAKDARKGAPKGYDIRAPRVAQREAEDETPEGRYIARLSGHHANCHEGFALITAAVLGALQRGAGKGAVDELATIYFASRLVYSALYIGGTSQAAGLARALTWTAGLGVCAWLLVGAK
jgi:uncharacterized MAPEG superfamily protein